MRHLNLSAIEILILDPDPFYRTILRRIVRGFGCNSVLEADAAAQALALLTPDRCARSIDIVISEWAGLGMPAADFLQRIRAGEQVANCMVPVIVVTCATSRADVLMARDAGATELLAKPISPKLLFDRLYSVVHEPRLFVRAPKYVGPDRRRFRAFAYEGSERRGAA
jgi:DNA-binding response OmpR family regulator